MSISLPSSLRASWFILDAGKNLYGTSRRMTALFSTRASALAAESIPEPISQETTGLPDPFGSSSSNATDLTPTVDPRLPRSVQAIYLKPLRREAQYGVPSCDLQMRSYSVRNLEFFADFALRAAYYLHLPAFGPVPLPRITERWTVPRSNFIHKKSQENFERITMRRLVQIKDGHPETVQLWLAYLRKHAYYGIGMKANIWDFEELGVGQRMDVSLENLKTSMESKWGPFGKETSRKTAEKVVEMMNNEKFKLASGGSQPMMD